MQSFIMTVGLPASGKSTWARKYAEDHHNFVIVSSDEILASFGDINDQSHNTEVFEEMQRRTNTALKNGESVIWDATNISSKRRTNILKQLPRNIFIYKVCILFLVPVQKCKELNQSRPRQVPEEVIDRMYYTWQTPWLFEGGDGILEHVSFLDPYTINDVLADIWGFNQQNKHHKETLDIHLIKTIDLMKNTYPSMIMAGLLHDWGKPETQVFTDSHENITKDAYYPHHENVGAYKTLFYVGNGLSQFELIHVSALITWHMLPFSWKTSEDYEKAKKKFGEEFYNELIDLHQADIAASQEVLDEQLDSH